MTPEERLQHNRKISEALERGEISVQEARRLRSELPFQVTPIAPIEAPQPIPYRPQSDPITAANEYVDARRLFLMTEQGLSEEEATRQAQEDVQKFVRPATVQYEQDPPIGLSRIVDVEKGLVRDEQGRIVEADSLELLGESFLRQRIGTQEDVEVAIAERKEAERKASFERQKRQELARIEREKRGVKMQEEAGFSALDWAEDLIAGGEETYQDVATEYLMSPVGLTGDVYETSLSAKLRMINTLPAAASATYEQLVPAMKETDKYRMADSGKFIDQFAVNVATAQGLPEAFSANQILTADGAYEDAIWWAGLYAEGMTIPVGVGLLGKGGQLTGKGLSKVGLKKTGKAVEIVSSPISSTAEYVRYKSTQKMVDQMFDEVGIEGINAKNVVDKYTSNQEDFGLFDKSAKRANLVNSTSEAIGEHFAVLHTTRAALDASGPEGIAIRDVQALTNTPTGLSIVINAGLTDKLTKANSGAFVTEQINKFKNAAKTNKDVARVYNESVAIQKQVQEGMARTTAPNRVATSNLTTSFQSQLVKNRIARLVSEGYVNNATLTKLLKFARKKDLSATDIGKINTLINRGTLKGTDATIGVLKGTEQTLDDIFFAMKDTLVVPVRERLLNFMPRNLSVIAGDTVVNTNVKGNRFWNSRSYKRYLNEQKNVNKNIKFDAKTEVYTIDDSIKDDLVRDIVDYFGADTIRQSDGLRTMLSNVLDNTITLADRNLIADASKAQSAVRHLGGFKLREAGTQYRRAAQTPELRGDVIALTEGKTLGEQFTKGFIGQSINTARKVWTANTNPAALVEGVQPSIGFVELQKQINNVQDKIIDQTTKRLKDLTKETNGQVALDQIGKESYDLAAQRVIDYTDNTVRIGFGGSYIKYIDTYVEDRFKPRLIKYAQGNEDRAREALIDHNTFFTKIDAWKSMINRYYNQVNVQAIFKDDVGLRDILKTTTGELQPVASNVLDTTFTNFVKVAKNLENTYPTLKPLRTRFAGKPTPTVPYSEWLIGVRSGDAIAQVQQKWIDKNPRYRLQYYPDYTSFKVQVDLVPLSTSYDNLFVENLRRTFNNRRLNFKDNSKKFGFTEKRLTKVLDGIGSRFANLHYDIVTKVTRAQREDLVNRLSQLMREQKTMYPTLETMQRSFKEVLAVPKKIIDNEINTVIKELFPKATAKQRIAISTRFKNTAWQLLFNPPPVDGKYYGSPSMGVMMDLTDNMRDFYRANGIAIDSKIAHTLDSNLPLFEAIQNTNFAQMYGPEQAQVVKSMSDMAATNKLPEMMQSIRKADEGMADNMLGLFGNATSWARRSMTQGMLAGFWLLANTKYLGVNILSAPFIMMGTVGTRRMTQALSPRNFWSSLRMATSIQQYADDVVVFTSDLGRQYTAKELRLLESNNNLGLTRNRIEFYETHAGEMLKAADTTITGTQRTGWNKFFDFVNPGQRNLFSYVADASDMTFRRATFYSALKEGKPISQAVDLAKRSLLDYGAMSHFEKNVMNRYTMFWSFNRQILAEFINLFAKAVVNDTSHKFVISAMRSSMKQQREAGLWLNGDDSTYGRVFAFGAKQHDNRDFGTYSFANPYTEAFSSYTTVATLFASAFSDKGDFGKVITNYLQNTRTRPALDFIRRKITNKYSGRPPADIVYLMKSTGNWDWFQKAFEVKSIREGEGLRLGDPTFSGYQYEFTGKGAESFANWLFLFTVLGTQRPIRDWTKAIMAADVKTEDMDLKRFADPNPFLFLLGAETSISNRDIMDTSFRNEKKIESDLKKIINEYKY